MRIILFRWYSDIVDVVLISSKIFQFIFMFMDFVSYAPYYHDKRDLFTIFWDKWICVEGFISSFNYSVDFECKFSIRGKNVRFMANSYDGTYRVYLFLYFILNGSFKSVDGIVYALPPDNRIVRRFYCRNYRPCWLSWLGNIR